MEFAFNPDQEMLRRTLADFAARELAPAYASRDQDEDLPRSLVFKLGELGLLAPMTEERHGGQELDYVSLGIAHEEIGRADFNAAYVLLLWGWSARSSALAETIASAPNIFRRFAAATR